MQAGIKSVWIWNEFRGTAVPQLSAQVSSGGHSIILCVGCWLWASSASVSSSTSVCILSTLCTPAALLSHWDSRVHREFTHMAVTWHYPDVFSTFLWTSGNQLLLLDFGFLVFIVSPALLRAIEFVV